MFVASTSKKSAGVTRSQSASKGSDTKGLPELPGPVELWLNQEPMVDGWWKKMGIHVGQWEFQDPKMEVLYHIRPYFAGIFPYIGLIYGRYLHFRILKFPFILDL